MMFMEHQYLHVVVHPGSKREKIEEKENGYLEIYCREPAEHGLANRCTKRLIAQHFNTTERAIRIVSGRRKPKKLVEILR